MEKRRFFAGITSILLVFGVITMGCDTENNDNNGNGTDEINGITVLPTNSGLAINLIVTAIPPGAQGIQYYIRGPGYSSPVQIWLSLTQAIAMPSLVYPFTEAGSEYSVSVQYTGMSGEPMSKTVTAKPTGGVGDIVLRNVSTVTYQSSNKGIDVYPAPDIKRPTQDIIGYGMELYLASENRNVYYVNLGTNATQFSLNDFKRGDSWDGGRPLSAYDGKSVFVELSYYLESATDTAFKVVIGKTGTFVFPYMD
jgi:hypothetical protein